MFGLTDEQADADAQLIAAAPTMADMLGKTYRALVAYAADEPLDATRLLVEIGDVLLAAGVEGFARAPKEVQH